MIMNVLITGVDGFVSSHLVDYILKNEKDVTIYGTIRRNADRKNIKHCASDINFIEMELTDPYSVRGAIKTSKPDKVFHLAGQTFVPTSWTAPGTTLEVNALGTLNVLEAVRDARPNAFVQVAGTSEEYGYVNEDECPITEDQPLRPLSPYGVSKVAADMYGYQFAKSYKMNILRTRSFNMTGPRRGGEFVDSNFAKQVAMIQDHMIPPIIYHGNMDAMRDFTDVRDSVRAYWKLSDLQWNGEVVNICSGKGYSMRKVLQILLALSNVEIQAEYDSSRGRPSDVPLLVGSNDKLRGLIDWKPEICYEDSMKDLLAYWEQQLRF